MRVDEIFKTFTSLLIKSINDLADHLIRLN